MTFRDFPTGRFYNGDCLEIMKEIPDGVIDMILCDLPYGTTQNKWDSIIPLDLLWAQYWRIAKPNAAIVLTAAQPFTSALIINNLKEFKQNLIWKKNIASNFLNANRQHLSRHEDIIIFCKQQTIFNKQMSLGKSYTNKRTGKDDTGDNYGKINKRTDTENEGSRNPISVLEFNREVGFHPTQKPVALFEYLIKTYTNPNMLVLDNTAGSGTTAIAAMNTGRKWVCIEQDETYYAKACERVENHNVPTVVVPETLPAVEVQVIPAISNVEVPCPTD